MIVAEIISEWIWIAGGVSLAACILTVAWVAMLRDIPDPDGPLGVWFLCSATAFAVGGLTNILIEATRI